MIGSFPDPYPDELLYSVCARFQARMQYPNKKSTLRELFGSTSRTAAIDLPSNIRQLLSNLPSIHRYTDKHIIDGHTLLPLFSHFLTHELTTQLREDMGGPGGLKTHRRSGIMASRIPTHDCLRFCPKCVDKDKDKIGETYWHRIHQIPGVIVCPMHKVFLMGSKAHQYLGRPSIGFSLAEDTVRISSVRNLDLSCRDHQILLRIACDAVWLLEHPALGSDLSAIYNRYIRLLITRDLATYKGSIRVNELLEEFNKYYSSTVLKLLHCKFTGRDQIKTNWLLRLVRPPKHAQHPLYHLLLMQFLGCTAEEFFQLPEEISFFGEGPWPCLNLAADHFRKPVISDYKLSSRLRDNRPTATFSCGCGFTYARSGPDSSPEDRFCIGRMLSFGQTWEAKLKRLWKDSSLSLSEVGRRLGVDPLTVRRHAARLKLPCYRHGRRSKPLKRETQLKGDIASHAWQKKRRTCRSRWLSAMECNPQVTLKKLRYSLPKEYAWLSQNDSRWLESHKPRLQQRTITKSSVDWKRRDSEYAAGVRDSASRLKNAPGRPVRVTKTAIGRAISAVTLLQQKLHKMPLTSQVLRNVVENPEHYAVRRIWWAADLYFQENTSPKEWQLIQRVNVYSLEDIPEVRRAIEASMSMIKSRVTQEQILQATS